MAEAAARTKLGQKVNLARAEKGVPPVVFAVQPTHFIRIESPEELKQFEQEPPKFLWYRHRSFSNGGACLRNLLRWV